MTPQVPLDVIIRETLSGFTGAGSVPIAWFPLFNRLLNEQGLRFKIKRSDGEHSLLCTIERIDELPAVTEKPVRGVNRS